MPKSEIKIAYVDNPVSYSIVDKKTKDHFAYLSNHLPSITENRIRLTLWEPDVHTISNIPRIATYDLVICNWSKYAYLLAQYLRENPEYPAKMVLYSGILFFNPSFFLVPPKDIKIMKSEGEIEDDFPDLFITKDSILNFGIFDYFISKVKQEWSANSWQQVISECHSRSPNRGDLRSEDCVNFFIYGWRDYEFRDSISHTYIYEQSSGHKFWFFNDTSRRVCLDRFKKHFMGDIMTNEITVKPLWDKPLLTNNGITKKCFVLMPFCDPFNIIYEDHIKSVLRTFDIECYRADDFYSTSSVMQDVWNGINNSLFIIAELTDKNPNVMYELGIAHTLGKKVILISQRDADVPFDFRHLRYFKYEYTPRGCEELEQKIIKAVIEIKNNPGK